MKHRAIKRGPLINERRGAPDQTSAMSARLSRERTRMRGIRNVRSQVRPRVIRAMNAAIMRDNDPDNGPGKRVLGAA